MNYPKVVIHLDKLKENALTVLDWAKKSNVDICFVNKVVCGDEIIAKELMPLGFSYLGDSRVENLAKNNISSPKLLLRIGSIENAKEVVKEADISLQSNIEVIKALDKAAKELDKVHKVILMIDLGDLREGLFYKDYDLICDTVNQILDLKNISLVGVGTNLTCYGSIVPTEKNLSTLVKIKNKLEKEFKISLPIVSGGNSSSLYLLKDGRLPEGVNMLRVGEAIMLGTDTATGNKFDELNDDTFILEAEIVELFNKPSFPIGKRSVDAFGRVQKYKNRGEMNRAILSIGRQDIEESMLTPIDDIEVIGASSDHVIINVKDHEYKVGDIIHFKVQYGSLLRLFTSPYVKKEYQR